MKNAMGRMWQSIRCLIRFSAREIIATSCCSERHARNYLSFLKSEGYLRKTPKGYVLLKDFGPEAPKFPCNCQKRRSAEK